MEIRNMKEKIRETRDTLLEDMEAMLLEGKMMKVAHKLDNLVEGKTKMEKIMKSQD